LGVARGNQRAGETWEETARREIAKETGAILGNLEPIGTYKGTSTDPEPRLPHLPHPVHVRVVCWADVTASFRAAVPDTLNTIVEVRTIRYQQALDLFGSEDRHFGELYDFAYRCRQHARGRTRE